MMKTTEQILMEAITLLKKVKPHLNPTTIGGIKSSTEVSEFLAEHQSLYNLLREFAADETSTTELLP